MAHLLMIESFLEGNAKILPELLTSLGHTYTFLTRSRDIYPKPDDSNEHEVLRFAKKIVETNTNSVLQIVESVSEEKFDGVLTTCDYYIEYVQQVAELLKIPCPFPKKVINVRHKHIMRSLIEDSMKYNPKFAIAYDWDDVVKKVKELGYPLVMKPVDLSSSAYVRLIKDISELKNAFALLEAFPINWRDQKRDNIYLLEEYLSGEEISVETVTYCGKTKIIGITQKSVAGAPYFVEDGHMYPADLADDIKEEVYICVNNVLKELEYDHGITHTEIKLTDDGPKIIEINPRVAGDYIANLIKMVDDIEILEAFIDLSIGVEPKILKRSTNVCSACIMFLLPENEGKIKAMVGQEHLYSNPNIINFEFINGVGKIVCKPVDNVGRLGRIITKDNKGYRAMQFAKEALNQIKVTYE